MRSYLVGGAVRDGLLGRHAADRDWLVVDETHASLVAKGFKPVGQLFVTYLHPGTGEQYSLPRGLRDNAASEREVITADLSARDLTINAIAISPEQEIVDPFNGRDDINAGVLRHISDAFSDDPVRILRIVRLAAELGFKIAPCTATMCRDLIASGCFVPAHRHRLFTEFLRATHGPYATECVLAMEQTGILSWLQSSSQEHASPVRETTIETLERLLRSGHSNSTSETALFAAVSFTLGVDGVCTKLVPPTAYLRIAHWYSQHYLACSDPRHVPAQSLNALLEDTRALRDDANLNCLIEAAATSADWDCKAPEYMALRNAMETALYAARGVTSAQIGSELQGHALGAALRKARAKAISDALAA